MSTAPLENAPNTIFALEWGRYTQIRDETGKHIITQDERTGMQWTAETLGEFDYYEAEEVCRNSRIGGYDDWRRPTDEELLAVTRGIAVWTCTPSENTRIGSAWVGGMGCLSTEDTDDKFSVIAVRGPVRTDATATPKAGAS
ncbi:DUF1566 domain-containing protein [Xylella fastidiosa]|uniref:DUF1566 domain-containing protein n=1 Tax=Xylella fastidiosa TaxID=2371 RepID=UPI00111CE07D|nr:DUF1566 domain-containing protein [Xylella fastidiosa]TNW21576.1 DUF1566 domain-containing protein [Xylella fastidiosa subsp. pauca]